MNSLACDVTVIGAGPYGLSLAAHLARGSQSFRVFGDCMSFWSRRMPVGMRLKSEGFASNLYEPDGAFTLQAYCTEQRIPYADIGLPVDVQTFIEYGQEFQRRFVPMLEETTIESLTRTNGLFMVESARGETFTTRKVVIAVGIARFAHMPAELERLPPELVTHSAWPQRLDRLRGRHVAVLGGGASAFDFAVALRQAGANVEVFARGPAIEFHDPPTEPRPIIERLKAPRSGLGLGWRSRLCSDLPLLFHGLPRTLRHRAVARHLGPAPCWFVRDQVVDKIPIHLGCTLVKAAAIAGTLRVEFAQAGAHREFEFEHLIAATGFRVALSRLNFIDSALRAEIAAAEDTPILDRHFESSVAGLHFIGASAANCFGPLLRFAYGARFAARRVAGRLALTG